MNIYALHCMQYIEKIKQSSTQCKKKKNRFVSFCLRFYFFSLLNAFPTFLFIFIRVRISLHSQRIRLQCGRAREFHFTCHEIGWCIVDGGCMKARRTFCLFSFTNCLVACYCILYTVRIFHTTRKTNGTGWNRFLDVYISCAFAR